MLVATLVFALFFLHPISHGESVKNIEAKTLNGSLNLVEGIENYESDLRQITCYCGCEHTDLYNCYEEGMLTNCGTCMGEYKDYLSMKNTNTIQEISTYINQKYPGMEDDDED